jgi:transcriptional regulator with XRE-family HTH domain
MAEPTTAVPQGEILQMPDSVKKYFQNPAQEKAPAPTATPVTSEIKPTEVVATSQTPVPVKEEEEPAEVVAEKKEVTETPAVATDDSFWLDDAPKTTDAPKSDAPAIDYEKVYQSLLKDPEIALIVEAKKAGRSLADVAKEYQQVDYTTMDAQGLVENYGKQHKWTAEQIESELEFYESKSLTEKQQIAAIWKGSLENEQKGKLEKLAGAYKEDAAKEAKIQQTFFKDLEDTANFMVDKEVAGIKMTKEDAQNFRDWTMNFSIAKEDGTYDVKLMQKLWIGANKLSAIQKAYQAKGESQGRKEVLTEVHQPDLKSSAPTRTPEAAPVKTPQEKVKNFVQAVRSGKIQPINP